MEVSHHFEIKRTDSSNKDFGKLVVLLDKELGENYQEEYDFYHQYNQIDNLKNVIVIYFNERPIGCGAIKQFDSSTMEVKRMFTHPDHRGTGVASKVLSELENWARELQFENCILETGTKQHAAMALYKKKGYTNIPNYGQYVGIATSICFHKRII